MDTFVTLDKINTLIADLLTTEAWREFLLPRLLKKDEKLNQIKMYMGMYHESSVCNLLEVMMYHRTACESSDDGIVELIDYCYRLFVKMTGKATEIERA
jgi:branched-subunit amino acid transport protein AzlD